MSEIAASSVADDAIQAVRRFNRFYTRQIGVLQEHLLRSRFSLTEVRVLFELAHRDNLTAAELRQELGLDRGYLSRMLQNFQKHRWIKATPSRVDRRRVFLSLTAKGLKVFAPLDRRSSEEVGAMLGRMSARDQKRFLLAIHEIESVLDEREMPQQGTSATPELTLRTPRPGDMGWVVQRHGELYWQEYKYDERFEALVAQIVAEFVQNFNPTRERCWIAERNGQRLGAILLVKKTEEIAKLRLLLVEPEARGLGIGKCLVSECVSFAREAGYGTILLWTQSELHAARHLYEQAGFKRIAEEPHQSWGRMDLVAETWELKL